MTYSDKIKKIRIGLAEVQSEMPIACSDRAKVLRGLHAIKTQQDEIESLRAQVESIKSISLNPTVIDLVRCGIGGNYGGIYYDNMIDKTHAPMVNLAKELSKENIKA